MKTYNVNLPWDDHVIYWTNVRQYKHIGFTGTQHGMSDRQKTKLHKYLREMKNEESQPLVFHHGDCIGADAEAGNIALSLQIPIHIHPPENNYKRANCFHHISSDVRPYLIRNHNMVDMCTIVFASPFGMIERQRSGTWATIRYARKFPEDKLIYILER